MTKQESLNKAAQEFGYADYEMANSSAVYADMDKIIHRAMDIYAGEQSEYTKSLEDEIKFHCEEKDKLEKELAFEKQNATDFASKADHYRNLLSESKKNYAVAWISVEERLPEAEGYYLVVVEKDVASSRRGVVEISDCYKTVYSGEEKLCFQPYVTHWQPLPTAP